jgi:hypothetical protein
MDYTLLVAVHWNAVTPPKMDTKREQEYYEQASKWFAELTVVYAMSLIIRRRLTTIVTRKVNSFPDQLRSFLGGLHQLMTAPRHGFQDDGLPRH